MVFCSIRAVAYFLLSVASLGRVRGQGLCACSPSAITLTFNLTGVCEDRNVAGPGLASAPSCSISPFSSGTVSSLVPMRITTISILEFGQNLQIISQSSDTVNLRDGDTYRFQSFSANPDAVTPQSVPRTLEVSIVADNASNEQVFLVWVINYSGDCNTFPVFSSSGQRIGWTTLTTLEDPSPQNCPAVGTRPPSTAVSPTRAPVALTQPPVPRSTKTPAPVGRSTKAPSSASNKTPAPVSCHRGQGEGKGKRGKRSSDDYYHPHCPDSSSSSSSKGKKGKKGESGKKGKRGKGEGKRGTGAPNTMPPVAAPKSASQSSSRDYSLDPPDTTQSQEPPITSNTTDAPPPYIPRTSNENTDEEEPSKDGRTRAVIGVSAGIGICALILGAVAGKLKQRHGQGLSKNKDYIYDPSTVADTTGSVSYDRTSEHGDDEDSDPDSDSYYQGSLSSDN